jgi:hypothetical protein
VVNRDGNLTRKPETRRVPTRWVHVRVKILTRGCNPHLTRSFAGMGMNLYLYPGALHLTQNLVYSLF